MKSQPQSSAQSFFLTIFPSILPAERRTPKRATWTESDLPSISLFPAYPTDTPIPRAKKLHRTNGVDWFVCAGALAPAVNCLPVVRVPYLRRGTPTGQCTARGRALLEPRRRFWARAHYPVLALRGMLSAVLAAFLCAGYPSGRGDLGAGAEVLVVNLAVVLPFAVNALAAAVDGRGLLRCHAGQGQGAQRDSPTAESHRHRTGDRHRAHACHAHGAGSMHQLAFLLPGPDLA